MNIDTSFVPMELDGASWSALEPLYASLRDRTVDDAADLETVLDWDREARGRAAATRRTTPTTPLRAHRATTLHNRRRS